MSVEIIFRGVCLFRQEQLEDTDNLSRLKDVWIPIGRPEGSLKHADASPAFPHYARMMVLDAFGNIVSRFNLDKTRIAVTDALGGDCAVQESFSHIPSFDDALERSGLAPRSTRSARALPSRALVKDDDARFGDAVTTVVTLHGGAVSASFSRSNVWQGPVLPGGKLAGDGKPLASQASWQSLSPVASLRIMRPGPDGEETMVGETVLDANHPRAFIYNFDVEWPSIALLSGQDEEVPDVKPGTAVFDDDFKWLYRMLPPGKLRLRRPLAAPRFVRPPGNAPLPRNPGSAGCYPARTFVSGG